MCKLKVWYWGCIQKFVLSKELQVIEGNTADFVVVDEDDVMFSKCEVSNAFRDPFISTQRVDELPGGAHVNVHFVVRIHLRNDNKIWVADLQRLTKIDELITSRKVGTYPCSVSSSIISL